MVSKVQQTSFESYDVNTKDVSEDRVNKLGAKTLCKASFFRQVFDKEHGQRKEFAMFLNNIFMQLDEDKFFTLIDDILKDESLDDQQVYSELLRRIEEARPGFIKTNMNALRSLKVLKKDLAEQVYKLMDKKARVNGFVEIGYPGRMIRPIAGKISLSGKKIVINDEERVSDYLQTGFPRPYNQFVSLNDYEPISEKDIPSNSVEMVNLFIGLHHAPQDKIDGFIDSIKRILKPGGSFILMDHDAHSDKMIKLVDVVHSVFNAATGESEKVQKEEVRNFQSLDHWTNLLEAHGFKRTDKGPFIREGDSTLNCLVRFEKQPENEEDIEPFLLSQPGYKREQLQTYFTGSEWHNVRVAQNYAKFLKTAPFNQYPYFKEIASAWKVYKNSWDAARKHASFSKLLTSEYNMMNLVITCFNTVEYAIKGIASYLFPLSPYKDGELQQSNRSVEREYQKISQDYCEFIEHTPFYDFPYIKRVGSIWKGFSEYWNSTKTENGLVKACFSADTLRNLSLATFATVELIAKGIISAPFSWMYNSEAFKEPDMIHMLVRDNGRLENLDERIELKHSFKNSNLKHIRIPRYFPFNDILKKLSANGIDTINIAGQKKVQIDIEVEQSQKNPTEGLKGCKSLYETDVPSYSTKQPTHKYISLDVDVSSLKDVLGFLKENGVKITYIHDF